MKKIIYRKSDLACVGVVQENTTFEWEMGHNVIPNFGGTIEDYDWCETGINRVKLVKNGNEVQAVEREDTKEEKQEKILRQLAELDKTISRILEDIVAQGNFNLHQSKLDIIAQKKALRQQLKDLEV
jgi:precorrin isomerase